MSTNVVFNGTTYSIPVEGDSDWGTNLSNYFVAIAAGAFQKTGGSFTLTAETNFGATFGLKTAYVKSQATNPASAGIFRLGNTESIKWRNAGNTADLDLTVSAGNALQFNGTSLLLSGSIVNADINAAAAIALSKLATVTASRALESTAGGVISASAVTSTELGYLSGVTSAIQTQLNNKQATGSYALTTGKLSQFAATTSAELAGVMSDETGTGALVFANTPTLVTPVLGTPASGNLSNCTSIPMAQASGTLAIANGGTGQTTQTAAFDALAPTTTKGDLAVHNGTDNVRLPVSTNGFVLTADSAEAAGVKWQAVTAAASGADGAIQFATGGVLASDATNFFWDYTSKRLGIGTALPVQGIHINGLDAIAAGIMIRRYSAGGGPNLQMQSAEGTEALPTAVTLVRVLGNLLYGGHDGTAFAQGANIAGASEATWTNVSHPTYLSFQTVASGSTALTERMRITSAGVVELTSGQLKFPATQNASADANTLDDYKEGTWTPSLGGGATYTAQSGKYTKIGNKVYIEGRLAVNQINAGSTSTISGLPFNNGASINGTVHIGYFGNTSIPYVYLTGLINTGAATIGMYGLTSAATSMVGATPFQSSTDIYFSAHYTV